MQGHSSTGSNVNCVLGILLYVCAVGKLPAQVYSSVSAVVTGEIASLVGH